MRGDQDFSQQDVRPARRIAAADRRGSSPLGFGFGCKAANSSTTSDRGRPWSPALSSLALTSTRPLTARAVPSFMDVNRSPCSPKAMIEHQTAASLPPSAFSLAVAYGLLLAPVRTWGAAAPPLSPFWGHDQE